MKLKENNEYENRIKNIDVISQRIQDILASKSGSRSDSTMKDSNQTKVSQIPSQNYSKLDILSDKSGKESSKNIGEKKASLADFTMDKCTVSIEYQSHKK